jgi:hypothetical protein
MEKRLMTDRNSNPLQIGDTVLLPSGEQCGVIWVEEGEGEEAEAPPHVRMVSRISSRLFSFLYPCLLIKVVEDLVWYQCDVCGKEITDTLITENVPEGEEARCWHLTCLPVAAKPEPPAHQEAPSMPEWMRTAINPLPRWLAILEAFQARGVQFRVCGGTLQYRDVANALSEGECGFIADSTEGLKTALLKQQRLCTRCGMEAAHRDADWCSECIRSEGWKHYQRLSSKLGKRARKKAETELTAVKTEERRLSLWD